MKKYLKLTALLLSLILITFSFSSCNQKQQTGASSSSSSVKSLKIGVIQFASHPSLDNCYNGFVQGLEAKGYKSGDNVTIDFQNAMASTETTDQIAKNMVSKGYDLIVGIATPAAISAFSAARNTDIPVVFCAVSDPLKAGLVKSLSAPGMNCTGTSDLLDLNAQLKMIRAFQPDAKKIGILYTTSEPNSAAQLTEIKKLAPNYGFEIVPQGVQDAADISQAATALAAKVDCINNFTDNNVVNNLSLVLAQANAKKIPVYGSEIEQVKKGCLASESLDYIYLGKQTGEIAARILGGEKAGSIPVAQIKDSAPCVNTNVLASLKLSIPNGYESIQKLTTTAK